MRTLSKKVVSVGLSLTMLFGLAATAAAVEIKDYSPTKITTVEQLQNIDLDGNYVLGGDLEINASTWTPIGTQAEPFTGTFDGNGSEYTITWTGTGTGSSYYGIFGSSSGVIANVKAEGDLTLTGSGSYVSPIVGYSTGSVYSCTSDVDFTGNNMDNVGGVVGAVYCNVQGNCVVDQCYSKDCTIYTTNSSKVYSGGLAGYVKGGITQLCQRDQLHGL